MQKVRNKLPFQVVRLGRADAGDQVKQAAASVTLEGIRPSKHSISLARAVADGEMTTDDAVGSLHGLYAHNT